MVGGKKKGGGGDEIDAVKAFIVIMAVLTLVLGGFSYFHLKTRRDDLERANDKAKKECEKIIRQKREIIRYLKAYEKTMEEGGIASPEEYFGGIRDLCNIPENRMIPDYEKPSRSKQKGDFKEIFCQIQLKEVTWDQLLKYMWFTESKSPKYRILSIESLQRTDQKSENDVWKINFKAAYRTQMDR